MLYYTYTPLAKRINSAPIPRKMDANRDKQSSFPMLLLALIDDPLDETS